MTTNIDIDTKKIKEAGNNIVNLSFELIEILNNFYRRIDEIPIKTREWVGSKAIDYTKLCDIEKEEYMKYINSLKLLGNSLVTYSENLDNIAKKVEEEL